jgi:hypothetical protein
MMPARRARWLAVVASALLALILGGCGVKYATVRTDRGEDLMLLGHDPVAYFAVGKPVRGYPNIQAQVRGATYYFACSGEVTRGYEAK